MCEASVLLILYVNWALRLPWVCIRTHRWLTWRPAWTVAPQSISVPLELVQLPVLQLGERHLLARLGRRGAGDPDPRLAVLWEVLCLIERLLCPLLPILLCLHHLKRLVRLGIQLELWRGGGIISCESTIVSCITLSFVQQGRVMACCRRLSKVDYPGACTLQGVC